MASSSSSSSPELSHSRHHNNTIPAPFKYANQADVLEDLSSRFILNLPDEELSSVERICMQVEQAHWYYEDFIREENPKFPSLPLKKFSEMLFNSCPLLQRWSHDHEQAFLNFMQYKTRVPVCGAIMLNDKWDKCVLVKGWKSSSGWGFPKGKINQDEPTHSCAIREVSEETGYDLTQQLKSDDFIEMSIKEQRITLYIVTGVPEDYPFQTRTRKEISKIEWFNLADLPTWRRNKQVSGKFYLISPFVPPLKEFIRANKPRRKQTKQARKPAVDLAVQLDGDGTTDADDSLQDALDSVHYDRDAQGSSSSSADNELQTPSPLSIEAVPVADSSSDTGKESQGIVDTHFARLLSGLTMSAKEEPFDATLSISPAASSTPTPADSPVKASQSSSPSPNSAASIGGVEHERTDRTRQQPSSPPSLTTTDHPTHPPLPVREPVSHPVEDTTRRMKHLALLESVANESLGAPPPTQGFGHPALMNIGAPFHSFVPPPPHPSSVPPPFVPLDRQFFNKSNICIGQPMPPVRPQEYRNFTNPHVQLPNFNDPIQGRPMTSNAALPPSHRLMHHSSSMSLHQGKLLSILGSIGGPLNAMPGHAPSTGMPNQQLNSSRVSPGNPLPLHAMAGVPPQQGVRMNGINHLAIVTPPVRGVQNGPLTAPLTFQSHPPVVNGLGRPNGLHHTPASKAQLLSILQPDGAVRSVVRPPGYPAVGM